MNIYQQIEHFLQQKVSIAPLVIFRIAFGSLLLFSHIRFFQKEWVYELYVLPKYHFAFISGLDALDSFGMHAVFIALILSSAFIVVGGFYRIATLVQFALFTYVELIDKTYYLNHYYLVSILCFWLCVVPANRWYSVDSILFPNIRSKECSNWHIFIFKCQLSVVYFFAGLAKVNHDWLINAQPMATWLPGKYQLPILGKLMAYKEIAFLFSWIGCLYDLTIWIFLWMKKSRPLAYLMVIVFHILTAILFPRIGMFPFIMITSTLIFFSSSWHEKVLNLLPFYKLYKRSGLKGNNDQLSVNNITLFITIYLLIQLYLPIRYLQYDGNLFWHERGYRFSWRVMLMEKNGYTSIIVKDPMTLKRKEIELSDYLTPFQEQQMKSQADMIYQFAHDYGKSFEKENGYKPEIYVKSRLSLNGRKSRPFLNPEINVYELSNPHEISWIIPFEDQ